jgi:Bacteriophage tail sheath protein
MPVTPSYPGVYVEEIPSGVRTIVGVPTSITAFLGRARWGPVDEPTTINSWGDFERWFGGLDVDYPMSYAIRDFYRNGGSQAIIVRLFRPKGTADGVAALEVDTLTLEAASPGDWGNSLFVEVDYDGITDDVAERYGLEKADLFNLTVRYLKDKTDTERTDDLAKERHINLSVADGPRRVDRVLAEESSLVRVPEDFELADKRPAEKSAATDDKGADSEPLNETTYAGDEDDKTGLRALDKADLFNLLCVPPDERDGDVPDGFLSTAMKYCVDRRAVLLVDARTGWDAPSDVVTDLGDGFLTGTDARNAAIYFPRVKQADPLRESQIDVFAPCGIIAGVIARTDTQRGIWKSPAGIDAALSGASGLAVNLTDAENGMLNPLGINCLRTFPIYGNVVWGARTARGADQIADEYKYLAVRRTALYIEESLFRGTKWVVFEPNDEPLWAQIRLNVGAFMHSLFRKGAFQGTTPKEAYLVKCDKETTTQDDINKGIVNILVGFAPLKPAEFVILQIQQIAGDIDV